MVTILQFVGRFIVGFGVSLSAIAECIYISEIAPAVSTVIMTLTPQSLYFTFVSICGGVFEQLARYTMRYHESDLHLGLYSS